VGCTHYRTNVYTATDVCSNAATCRQTLIWTEDEEPPLIHCPPDILGETDLNQCSKSNVIYSVDLIDNCPGVALDCIPSSGSTFALGTTTVVCTAKDCGNNMVACSFRVVIHDTAPPAIQCPLDVVGNTDADQCSKSNVTYTATATDNCPGVTLVCSPPSGSTFAQGTNTVICKATDGENNTAECLFLVIILDTVPPAITCPLDRVAEVDAAECSKSNVTYTVTATDNCPGVTLACTPPSGSTFGLGPTRVTCIAMDASSNSNGCSFTITIVDKSAPVLSVVRQGGDVMICWPSTCTYVLQETVDLNPPIDWSPVSAPVSVVGDTYCVTLTLDDANRFFTLSGN
jgi:hypothetical protein